MKDYLEYCRKNWENLSSKDRVQFMKLRLEWVKENPVYGRPIGLTKEQLFDKRAGRI